MRVSVEAGRLSNSCCWPVAGSIRYSVSVSDGATGVCRLVVSVRSLTLRNEYHDVSNPSRRSGGISTEDHWSLR